MLAGSIRADADGVLVDVQALAVGLGRLSRGGDWVVRVEVVGVRGEWELVGSDVRVLDGDFVGGPLAKDVIVLCDGEEEEGSWVDGERDVAVVGRRRGAGELGRVERASRRESRLF